MNVLCALLSQRNPPSCRFRGGRCASTWCAAGRSLPGSLCSASVWGRRETKYETLVLKKQERRKAGRRSPRADPPLVLMAMILRRAPSLTMVRTCCLSLWLRLLRMWHKSAVTSAGSRPSSPPSPPSPPSSGSISSSSGSTCFTWGGRHGRTR